MLDGQDSSDHHNWAIVVASTEQQSKKKKMKKRALELPRRASKRLAGLPLDPVPGLETTIPSSRAMASQRKEEAKQQIPVEQQSRVVVPASPWISKLWEDPCIAFAIRTLTGDSCGGHDYCSSQVSATRGAENHVNFSSVSSTVFVTKMSHNGEKKMESINVSCAWSDPCVEFAFKILTDAIPLDYDQISRRTTTAPPSFGFSCARTEDR